ncbi:hypothetical protein [Pseudomonas savastanoi]|uniref:HEPN domain-containing protein n=1 Tax=Pseudomonas savastanoi TaxID=29438 RepID=A0AAW3M8P9_PSESS|nr:hypothetical protein [Pseudomonas savastanoi]KTC62382.1 hypothetical protein AO287_26320 [Pseudomonas savastanoi]
MHDDDEDEFELYDAPTPRMTLVEDRSHENLWLHRANDLHASAGAIWLSMADNRGKDSAKELGLREGFDMMRACFPVYHMLCGLSLEVVMKAVLVSLREKPPEHHDLNLLAHLLGVKRNPAQKKILNFYQHSVVWAGRYPIPKDATDDDLAKYYEMHNSLLFKGKTAVKGTQLKTYSRIGATDWDRFDALYRSYSTLFDHRY